MEAHADIFSYENDPNTDNNRIFPLLPIHCGAWIAPTAVVSPTSSIAKTGCTYLGEAAEVRAHATLDKGAAVGQVTDEPEPRPTDDKAIVERYAHMGRDATLEAGGPPPHETRIGVHAELGARSWLRGELGDRAVIGSNVNFRTGYVAWLVVEAGGKIGSGSTAPLPYPPQALRVFSGAVIPPGTVITEAYCAANPTVCRFEPPPT
jgi:hypothetical protein